MSLTLFFLRADAPSKYMMIIEDLQGIDSFTVFGPLSSVPSLHFCLSGRTQEVLFEDDDRSRVFPRVSGTARDNT